MDKKHWIPFPPLCLAIVFRLPNKKVILIFRCRRQDLTPISVVFLFRRSFC